MTGSSPSDLVVAFRSFPRRMEQAGLGTDDDAQRALVEAELAGVDAAIARSAGRLGVAADAHVIADAIAAIHPDRWDPEVLEGLRADALEAGAALRRAEAAKA